MGLARELLCVFYQDSGTAVYSVYVEAKHETARDSEDDESGLLPSSTR